MFAVSLLDIDLTRWGPVHFRPRAPVVVLPLKKHNTKINILFDSFFFFSCAFLLLVIRAPSRLYFVCYCSSVSSKNYVHTVCIYCACNFRAFSFPGSKMSTFCLAPLCLMQKHKVPVSICMRSSEHDDVKTKEVHISSRISHASVLDVEEHDKNLGIWWPGNKSRSAIYMHWQNSV